MAAERFTQRTVLALRCTREPLTAFEAMFDQFRDVLRDRLLHGDGTISRWDAVSRNHGNLLAIALGDRNAVLYVKESNTEIGFWGLNPNRLDALRESAHRWAVVLLLGPSHRGYLLPAEFVAARLGTVWSQSATGDYKVHEGGDVDPLAPMKYEALITAIIDWLSSSEQEEIAPFKHETYEQPLHAIVRLPWSDTVLSVKPSNVRFLDLVAATAAVILAPGASAGAMAIKGLPILARLVEVITDDEALVLRCFVDIAGGARATDEQRLSAAVNAELAKRGRMEMKTAPLRAIMEALERKKVVRPLPGSPRSWQLAESDVWR
jgi:hypothetical protein